VYVRVSLACNRNENDNTSKIGKINFFINCFLPYMDDSLPFSKIK